MTDKFLQAQVAPMLARLPTPEGEAHARAFWHGSMRVVVYAPRGEDPQQPHDQDELYVVVDGRGSIVVGEERAEFGPGDVLFVPAGAAHRFVDFTDDFVVWAIFYGPLGGESAP